MDNKNVSKNIFLIIALAIVIVMAVGIVLYDFIPSGSTVKEANMYETSEEVAEIITEIEDDSSTMNSDDSYIGVTSGSGIVLKSYSVTETDLALYSATGSYNSGKSDPFADYTAPVTVTEDSDSSSSATQGTTGETSSSNASGKASTSSSSSDGTLFNSTNKK